MEEILKKAIHSLNSHLEDRFILPRTLENEKLVSLWSYTYRISYGEDGRERRCYPILSGADYLEHQIIVTRDKNYKQDWYGELEYQLFLTVRMENEL